MKRGIFLFSFILGAFLLFDAGCSKSDSPPPPVTDSQGNTYKTVRIGEQTWMAENLKTSEFSDGTSIPVVSDTTAWSALDTPGLCWYNNKGDSIWEIYGGLYNFYAVASGKLCPAGWHIPSDEDIQTLMNFLGDTLTGGGSLKEEGTAHWKPPNTGAVNNTGFTALPAGIRYFEGSYSSLSWFTSFWSSAEYDSSKGWYLSLYYSDAAARLNKASKKDGFSVRCIKN
jgi:uncharacterized protein (TIGR02145 family)